MVLPKEKQIMFNMFRNTKYNPS